MIVAAPLVTPVRLRGRAAMAHERAMIARAMLAECRLCAHQCGVNRLAGERGPCRAGTEARFFCAQPEVTDELELVPTFAIALSGCDLRCDFCITGRESWDPRAGQPLDAVEVASRAQAALMNGARTVMILGGELTIHLPAVLALVAELPDTARLVWKTNAHGSAAARRLLDGMFDVWLADYKFGNDDCARRLARVSNYTAIVRKNLIWAEDRSELIVRHLVMPGHVDCCWQPIAEWLASILPGVKVNLRTGFWPAWRSSRHGELCGTVRADEACRAEDVARSCGLNLVS